MRSLMMTLGQLLFSVFMYTMGAVFFGLALVPGLSFFFYMVLISSQAPELVRLFVMGFGIASAYFIFGFFLILLVGIFRAGLGLKLKEGTYPLFSFEALKWAFVSSLYLMVNFTFIDFILLTPFSNLLFRLLGAKLGRNVQFNSRHVYDATLIEIGDNTVVGGEAIILGHIVERGRLKLKKVKIGKNVTIGSHSTIMPGCEIGDGAVIGASAVLLKDTKVEARDVWFGIPAQSIRHKSQTDSHPEK